tara:strand:+ start:1230 stop:1610 length:381 start_codon:yes stop_codon:yes gene_type:complete
LIKFILLISLGGAIGAPLRFIISLVISNYTKFAFPLGTLIVNIIGSFLIGIFAAIIKNNYYFDETLIKYFFMIGFLGSFTTFSAFSIEVMNLFNIGNYSYAISYILLSIILNIIAVYLGINIFKIL